MTTLTELLTPEAAAEEFVKKVAKDSGKRTNVCTFINVGIVSPEELTNRIKSYPFKPGQPLTHPAPVDPVEAFRGKGKGGATARLLQDRQSLSLADAWIAAAALENSAILVHKDPEFENLTGLLEERLPYK